MISRREVLVAGGGGLAAVSFGAIGQRASATRPVATPALFLVDTSLAGAAAAAEAARRSGIPLASFAGDFGSAWLDHLEPLWRRGPAPIAGLTTAGALFCAEQFARGHGFACSFKSSGPVPQDAPLLWALGPRGSEIIGWTRS